MASNMATNMDENTVSEGDPNQAVPPDTIKEEPKENLYIDAANAEQPEIIQPSQAGTQPKRVDARQDWINTDKTKPYFCKLCDYNMDCSEVCTLSVPASYLAAYFYKA